MNKKKPAIKKDYAKNITVEEQKSHEEEQKTDIIIPTFNPQKPKIFINWLKEHDENWKDLSDKNSKRAYLKGNKKRLGLDNTAIGIIIGLIPSKAQEQLYTKSKTTFPRKKNKKKVDEVVKELVKDKKFEKKYELFLKKNLSKNRLIEYIKDMHNISHNRTISVIEEYQLKYPSVHKVTKKIIKGSFRPPTGVNKKVAKILEKEEDILLFLSSLLKKRIVGEVGPIQIIILTLLSSFLLLEPLRILIISASSSGKSYLIKKILDFFPSLFNAELIDSDGFVEIRLGRGGYVSFHHITFAALTRLTENNPKIFEGKCLILHELPEKPTEDDIRVHQAIRQYMSDAEYSRYLTDKEVGRPKKLKLEGSCAAIAEVADIKQEDQTESRFISVSLDETSQQTEAIVNAQAHQRLKYLIPKNVKKDQKELFSAIINSFIVNRVFNDKNVEAWNPDKTKFANEWAQILTDYLKEKHKKDPRLRRYNEQVHLIVEAITRLQFRQRKIIDDLDGDGNKIRVIIADLWDNAKALGLIDLLLEKTFEGVTNSAGVFLEEYIRKYFETPDEPLLFTYRNIADIAGCSTENVRKKINMLKEAGFVEQVDTSKIEGLKESRAYHFRLTGTTPTISNSPSIEAYMKDLEKRRYVQQP